MLFYLSAMTFRRNLTTEEDPQVVSFLDCVQLSAFAQLADPPIAILYCHLIVHSSRLRLHLGRRFLKLRRIARIVRSRNSQLRLIRSDNRLFRRGAFGGRSCHLASAPSMHTQDAGVRQRLHLVFAPQSSSFTAHIPFSFLAFIIRFFPSMLHVPRDTRIVVRILNAWCRRIPVSHELYGIASAFRILVHFRSAHSLHWT